MFQRRWIVLFGIIAFVAFIKMETACAALLKDIRVGEHDTFTRIVIELDTETAANAIVSEDDDRLSITLSDVRPELVRKIPVDGAPGIKDLDIRTDRHRLVVSFQLLHEHSNIEYFFIGDPPRHIVDVHFRPEQDASSDAAAPDASPPQPAYGFGVTSDPLPTLNQKPDHANEPLKPKSLSPDPKDIHSGAPAAASALVEQTERPSQPPRTGIRLADNKIQSEPPFVQRGESLQRYLVIALVVIVVGVLILLVAMLLLRGGWSDGHGAVLSTKEYLKRQDDRIAALNARIKEQLERYEKS